MSSKTTRQVVITGAGVLTPLGQTLDALCRALHSGHVALRARTFTAPGGSTRRMVAVLDEIPRAAGLSATESRFFSKLSLAALFCAEKAVNFAKVDANCIDSRRSGVLFGSGFSNLYDLEPVYETFFTGDERRLSPLVIPTNMASCPAGRLSQRYGLRGTTRTVSTACASASTALADAWRLIRDGSHDLMLAGGADLVCCTTLVRSWERLRILCPATDDPNMACRPFDRDRNGLALGDGAAVFVLEERGRALARGAPILAELSGAFENADGFDMLKPSADGEALCIEGALQAAGVSPSDIDAVQAHGTATSLNDSTEFAALSKALGPRASEVPISAIKAMLGHTMGASGALGLAAAIGSLQHGFVYPVPGYRRPDDGVAINLSHQGRTHAGINNVLINAFGFGGANACLIASRVKTGD